MWGCCRLAVTLISPRNRSPPSTAEQLGVEDLDGDPAAVLEVLGEINRRHASLADLPLEAVAVGQGAGEARGGGGQRQAPFAGGLGKAGGVSGMVINMRARRASGQQGAYMLAVCALSSRAQRGTYLSGLRATDEKVPRCARDDGGPGRYCPWSSPPVTTGCITHPLALCPKLWVTSKSTSRIFSGTSSTNAPPVSCTLSPDWA